MSFLLCHECYTWVDPQEGRCPECQHVVDVELPDPPLPALESTIGEIISRIGEVRLRRRMLPDLGTLYGTTNGFFFVPHVLHRVPRTIESATATSSLMWTLAALMWAPLLFVAPLFRTTRPRLAHVAVFRARIINAGDSHRMPELLMENPGVFFVPKRLIRTVVRRRNMWRVDRWRGAALKLRPAGNPQRFHSRMEDLLSSAAWDGVAVKT